MDAELSELRKQIDTVDDTLLAMLIKRFSLVEKVGIYKKTHALAVVDKDREANILTRLTAKAQEHNISPVFVERLWKTIMQESYTRER